MNDVSDKPALVAPYFAVIFRSQRTDSDAQAYAAVATRMLELADAQPGFLDVVSYNEADGRGITVSYWSSREAIDNWRQHVEHLQAQQQGRDEFYADFILEVCEVQRVARWSSPISP